MPETKNQKLIDKEKLEQLMGLLNLNTLETLKDHIQSIEYSDQDSFVDKVCQGNEDGKKIFDNDELNELCKNKSILINSIQKAIESKQEEQSNAAAAIISPNGLLIIQENNKDQEKTIKKIKNIYKKITKKECKYKQYGSQEEVLNDIKNKELPEEIKGVLSENVFQNGYRLEVYTFTFTSEKDYQNFVEKINPLIQQRKLSYLKTEDALQSTPTTLKEENPSETLSAQCSPPPFQEIYVNREPIPVTHSSTDSPSIEKQQPGLSSSSSFRP